MHQRTQTKQTCVCVRERGRAGGTRSKNSKPTKTKQSLDENKKTKEKTHTMTRKLVCKSLSNSTTEDAVADSDKSISEKSAFRFWLPINDTDWNCIFVDLHYACFRLRMRDRGQNLTLKLGPQAKNNIDKIINKALTIHCCCYFFLVYSFQNSSNGKQTVKDHFYWLNDWLYAPVELARIFEVKRQAWILIIKRTHVRVYRILFL